MKFQTHGNLTVDQWRVEVTSITAAETPGSIARRAAQTTLDQSSSQSRLIPTIVGFAAVYAVNTLAVSLMAVDGPLPFGDIIGLGLWMIPDADIFAYGYDLVD